MNRLPSEREDAGLQSVFKSVFPISDFRENSSLEFIEYSIGNWECKCGKAVRPASSAAAVHGAAARRSRPIRYGEHERFVPVVRPREPGPRERLRRLRQHGRDEAQVRRRGVPGARDDLRRAAEGHDPPGRVEQGSRDRGQDHPRHQGAGGLLRRRSADDGQRHVHHQRHRARHRVAATPVTRVRSSTPRTRRCSSRRSSRIADRGWSSSTTRRTCSTFGSTGSGSSSPACSCARSVCADADEIIRTFYQVDRISLKVRRRCAGPWATAWWICAPPRTTDRKTPPRPTVVQGRQEDHAVGRRSAPQGEGSSGSQCPTLSWKARSRQRTSSIRPPVR